MFWRQSNAIYVSVKKTPIKDGISLLAQSIERLNEAIAI